LLENKHFRRVLPSETSLNIVTISVGKVVIIITVFVVWWAVSE